MAGWDPLVSWDQTPWIEVALLEPTVALQGFLGRRRAPAGGLPDELARSVPLASREEHKVVEHPLAVWCCQSLQRPLRWANFAMTQRTRLGR